MESGGAGFVLPALQLDVASTCPLLQVAPDVLSDRPGLF